MKNVGFRNDLDLFPGRGNYELRKGRRGVTAENRVELVSSKTQHARAFLT
jgi:hypothetical protein